jgi:hypothetical protein
MSAWVFEGYHKHAAETNGKQSNAILMVGGCTLRCSS